MMSKFTIFVPDGVFGGTTTAVVTPVPSGTDKVFVRAIGTQGGKVVYTQTEIVDAQGHATLMLGPTPYWLSGPATCTAEVGSFRDGRWHPVASTTFAVAG